MNENITCFSCGQSIHPERIEFLKSQGIYEDQMTDIKCSSTQRVRVNSNKINWFEESSKQDCEKASGEAVFAFLS